MTPQSRTSETPLHAYGVMRFCYPARSGYRQSYDTVSERRAMLYDRARLTRRLSYFEHIALPSLRAQSDQNFTLGILIGDGLPDWAIERLLALIEPCANIALCPRPEGGWLKYVIRTVMQEMRSGQNGPVLQFRHDDDDAVHHEFIAALRDLAQTALPRLNRDPIVTLDFPKGVTILPRPDGLYGRRINRAGIGVALGTLSRDDQDFCIYDDRHHALTQKYPTLTGDLKPAYLRLLHGENDSFNPNNPLLQTFAPLTDHELEALSAQMGLPPRGLRRHLGQSAVSAKA